MLGFISRQKRKILNRYGTSRLKKHIVGGNHSVANVDKKNVKDFTKKGFSLVDSMAFSLKYNDYREYINTWE